MNESTFPDILAELEQQFIFERNRTSTLQAMMPYHVAKYTLQLISNNLCKGLNRGRRYRYWVLILLGVMAAAYVAHQAGIFSGSKPERN